jgi:hypothetical protein
MSNEAVKALLSNSGEAAALTGGGILADNFRRMLFALQVDEQKWDVLMDKFVNQELQLVEKRDDSTREALVANLTKELTAPSLSWKTYLNGLRFLGLTSATITVVGAINSVPLTPVVSQVTWTGPREPDAGQDLK